MQSELVLWDLGVNFAGALLGVFAGHTLASAKQRKDEAKAARRRRDVIIYGVRLGLTWNTQQIAIIGERISPSGRHVKRPWPPLTTIGTAHFEYDPLVTIEVLGDGYRHLCECQARVQIINRLVDRIRRVEEHLTSGKDARLDTEVVDLATTLERIAIQEESERFLEAYHQLLPYVSPFDPRPSAQEKLAR